ncbi:hypothetical protein BDV96DRAFT_222444 [Lophiotrema nucula]|uniref:Uncharacterized protein n=1 Tax=Lophiotrema nucula TaxID=690887 RepID=A0A6A5YSN1_9PLEO|nr:hypothetical protein BDV96DRAFT_222444 [Lophiotrema nucula]
MSFPRPRKRQRLDTGYHTPTQPLAHTKHSATDQPGVPSSNQHPYHRASPVSATGMNNPYQGEIIDLTGNDNGRYPDHDARHLGGPYLLDSARSREHTHGSDPQQHYHAVDLLEDDFGGYDVYRGAMHGYHNQSASQPSQRFRGGVKKDMVCERPTKLDANLLPQRATYQGVSVVTPPDGTQRYPFDIDPSPTSSHHAHIGLGAPITPPPSQNPSSHPTPSMAPMSRASVTRPPPIPDIPPAINSDGEPVLSGEQQKLLSLMLSRKNVFYTGSAGTGKSTVLRAFVKKATEQKRHVKYVRPRHKVSVDLQSQHETRLESHFIIENIYTLRSIVSR